MVKPKRTIKLSELAAQTGLQYRGDGECLIDGIAALADATTTQISFLANPAYRTYLATSQAAAVILTTRDARNHMGNCLLSKNPYLSYANIAMLFDTRRAHEPGIDDTARIDPTTKLGNEVYVGANCVIGPGCVIADGCSIGPGTVLSADCKLAENCRLLANVTLCEGVTIGQRTIIHPGAIIGADGFRIGI